jgi:hypothetical protein
LSSGFALWDFASLHGVLVYWCIGVLVYWCIGRIIIYLTNNQ